MRMSVLGSLPGYSTNRRRSWSDAVRIRKYEPLLVSPIARLGQ